MTTTPLDDAFRHHTWATLRLLDACSALTPKQLATDVPGTRGSILRTLQHIIGSHDSYLCLLDPDRTLANDTKTMGLAELRAVVDSTAEGWAEYLGSNPDADEMVLEVDDEDGFRRDAPVGIRLTQALHHGNEHRSQVSSAMTALGVEPPDVSAWAYGLDTGRSTDVLAQG